MPTLAADHDPYGAAVTNTNAAIFLRRCCGAENVILVGLIAQGTVTCARTAMLCLWLARHAQYQPSREAKCESPSLCPKGEWGSLRPGAVRAQMCRHATGHLRLGADNVTDRGSPTGVGEYSPGALLSA